MDLSASDRKQIEAVVSVLRDVLGADLVGAYLFGSAVLGGLKPPSDVDVLAVAARPTTPDDKRRLVERLLEASLRPRPLELTIVAQPEVRPWRYPPRIDFQYGDWWRTEFERGELEPWGDAESPDLAVLITKVLLCGRPLVGPPPAEVLAPVPPEDVVAAMTAGARELVEHLEEDTRNKVLTLARIWSTAATGAIPSKGEAAGWVLERLPQEHRAVLERARAGYLGAERESWDDLQEDVRSYAAHVVGAIDRASDEFRRHGRSKE